jgi:hypothetical protein
VNSVSPPPMEKNQKAMGMTLSFRFSEAIHWIMKRAEKNACPTNPTDSQKCALLILREAAPSGLLVLGLQGRRARRDLRQASRRICHSRISRRPRLDGRDVELLLVGRDLLRQLGARLLKGLAFVVRAGHRQDHNIEGKVGSLTAGRGGRFASIARLRKSINSIDRWAGIVRARHRKSTRPIAPSNDPPSLRGAHL